jgi:hypothetical protein
MTATNEMGSDKILSKNLLAIDQTFDTIEKDGVQATHIYI